MKAIVLVFFSSRHAEEKNILHGVLSYVEERALPWEVVPCIELTDKLINQLKEEPGTAVVIIGRRASIVEPVLRPGFLWVDYAYAQTPPSGDAHVLFDPISVGRVAANYLIAAGAKTCIVKGPLPAKQNDVDPRIRSFQHICAQAGMPCHVHRDQSAQSHEDILASLQTLHESCPGPLGIFMHNDDDAKFILDCLNQLNIAVPDQAMVIGGSGTDNSAFLFPSLSTVRLPFLSLGRTAALQAHRLLTQAETPPGLVSAFSVIERHSTRRDLHTTDTVIKRAARYFQRKRVNIPTVAELAVYCKVPRAKLFHHFKQFLDQTPKQWILNRAMNLAMELLAETDLTLTAIAKRCGYQHITSFIYRFKSYVGVTPDAYRREHR